MSISWNIERFDTLPSTQDVAKARAREGAEEGLVIQAFQQSAGKGRHGNQWDSPAGNLYMSVLLRPDCPADQAGQLSFVVAVALSAAMDDFIDEGHSKTLKWPNDILINNLKCAGILLESELTSKGRVESLIVGIGVNLLAPPPASAGAGFNRIGLQQVTDKKVEIHLFRGCVLEQLDKYYVRWKEDGFAAIRNLWLAQAHGLNQEIEVRFADKKLHGVFKNIDKNGALQLKSGSEILTINSGDVYF